MYISELVERLQAIEAQYGDMHVDFIGTLSEDPDTEVIPIAGVSVYIDESGSPVAATICDDLTLDEYAHSGGASDV